MTAATGQPAKGGSLEGKVIGVTGASGDLGRSIVARIERAGAIAVGCDVKKGAAVESCDVTDRASLDGFVKRILERHGRLDAMVAGAGVVERSAAIDLDEASWSRVIRINLTGAFHTAQSAARAMGDRGGSIVFIGSWIGVMPARYLMSYCVSKAGIDMLARCLALELAPRGIRVNVVAPGVVEAGVSAQIFREAPERRQEMEQVIPIGRLSQPDDVSDCVEFLLSERSSYVTGTTLVVDGGIRLAHAGG
jgi:glucose 1-dehydrogenase